MEDGSSVLLALVVLRTGPRDEGLKGLSSAKDAGPLGLSEGNLRSIPSCEQFGSKVELVGTKRGVTAVLSFPWGLEV